MRSMVGFVVVFGMLATTGAAQAPRGLNVTPEEFEAKLGYQTGTISIKDGLATIELPKEFRYLGPEGARRLLVDGWGNPPAAAENVLGSLLKRVGL